MQNALSEIFKEIDAKDFARTLLRKCSDVGILLKKGFSCHHFALLSFQSGNMPFHKFLFILEFLCNFEEHKTPLFLAAALHVMKSAQILQWRFFSWNVCSFSNRSNFTAQCRISRKTGKIFLAFLKSPKNCRLKKATLYASMKFFGTVTIFGPKPRNLEAEIFWAREDSPTIRCLSALWEKNISTEF